MKGKEYTIFKFHFLIFFLWLKDFSSIFTIGFNIEIVVYVVYLEMKIHIMELKYFISEQLILDE